jgi:DNA primase
MPVDLQLIRDRNPIEAVIAEKFALRKSSSRFIGIEHDSLVVLPATGMYFWNSRDEHGDVFDFVGRHILALGTWNHRDATQFMEVVHYLAQRAGIVLDDGTVQQSATWAERQLVLRLHDALLNTPAALDYVTKVRGWQLATVKAARLGYVPPDKRAVLADLHLSDMLRAVINKIPVGMVVYPHLDVGRLCYLSGRSIEGKQHYNPPRELIGERQPYANPVYSARLVWVSNQPSLSSLRAHS